MKKNIKFYVIILSLLLANNLVSCSSDESGESQEKTALNLTPTLLEYTAEGGFKVLNLSVDTSTSWEVKNIPSWCSFSATSGSGNKSINIEVEANTLEETRSATIVVSTANKTIDVQITQEALVIVLSVSSTSLDYTVDGGSEELIITTGSGISWEITNIPSWLTFSKTSDTGSQTISVETQANAINEYRLATVTVSTGNEFIDVEIEQAYGSGLYPNYNLTPIVADAIGMSSTAVELAANMTMGWNIGNSLEATGSETAWGNPAVTKNLIDLVKQNGFNAFRIPCSWDQYLSNSDAAKIDEVWLERVKEVVQYSMDNDMYVIINIHWDGGWLENNVTLENKEENNAKQKAYWQQIATYFRDFDEHLLFASANEPNVDDATGMTVLNSYHQTFIDAVRATGGKNAYRTLVVQGPSTDIEKTNSLMTTLPTDTATNRMMAEVHYYTPWNFCGLEADASWGDMFYYWGADYHSTTDTSRNATWGEEDDLDGYFDLMKTQFTDNGIPVILGEFGAIRRTTLTGDNLTLHLESRAYYLKYIVQQAKANGIIPFYWDEGNLGNHGFGIFNRADNTVFDEQALTALQEGLN